MAKKKEKGLCNVRARYVGEWRKGEELGEEKVSTMPGSDVKGSGKKKGRKEISRVMEGKSPQEGEKAEGQSEVRKFSKGF